MFGIILFFLVANDVVRIDAPVRPNPNVILSNRKAMGRRKVVNISIQRLFRILAQSCQVDGNVILIDLGNNVRMSKEI